MTTRLLMRFAVWAVRWLLPPLVALLFVLPLIWVIGNSLRQPGIMPQPQITIWPNPAYWSNYVQVFQDFPIGQALINSLFVVALAVPLTLITASWAGFAMAQLEGKLRRRLVLLTVILMIVPLPALWFPRFVMFTAVGLVDTLWALIVPALMGSSPFFVLLFYWTFRRMPKDLYDSARLDGASVLQLWRKIAMPLATPTTAVVAVLAFALYWSDYISPLVYLRSEELYTFAYRLQLFTQENPLIQPFAMAGVVIAIIPIVILFLFVQRYFWPEGRLGGLSGR